MENWSAICIIVIILLIILYNVPTPCRNYIKVGTVNIQDGPYDLATPMNTRVKVPNENKTEPLWLTSYSHPNYDNVGRRLGSVDADVQTPLKPAAEMIMAPQKLPTVYEHL